MVLKDVLFIIILLLFLILITLNYCYQKKQVELLKINKELNERMLKLNEKILELNTKIFNSNHILITYLKNNVEKSKD